MRLNRNLNNIANMAVYSIGQDDIPDYLRLLHTVSTIVLTFDEAPSIEEVKIVEGEVERCAPHPECYCILDSEYSKMAQSCLRFLQ